MLLTLYRKTEYPNGGGTPGDLIVPFANEGKGMAFATMENPWLDNQEDISCIPPGTYRCEWVKASWSKFGDRYEIRDVPDRTAILFHSGNTTKDTLGCILIGSHHYETGYAIRESRKARREFEQVMAGETFNLEIVPAKDAD